MKRTFSFLIALCLIAGSVHAQTRTRKVPFLPYTGMTTTVVGSGTAAGTSKNQPFQKKPVAKAYETIVFNAGSAEIRPDQAEKIIQIGRRLEKEGGAFYTVVSFTTPSISTSLAGARSYAVTGALSDFKVGAPIYKTEFRKRPVVNPNRIEIYIK